MQIDFILQGKGGVGKSLIASLLAQYYTSRDHAPVCIDTDPVNATFAGYKAFKAEALSIMEGDDINPRAFDQLVERIMAPRDDGATVMVIDNGASTFVPLCSYILQNDLVNLVHEAGHTIRFHTVITGGQALADTTEGFTSLCENIAGVPIVVWINEYFGQPVRNGKTFEDSNVLKRYQDRVHALVTIPAVKPETFGRDMQMMLNRRDTFAEADASPDYGIMERQRLRMMWRKLEAQMERARL
ncbi:MAG: conjugal transfer protein TraL [Pseudomonadota bacterium]